jgi:hypothetical protein
VKVWIASLALAMTSENAEAAPFASSLRARRFRARRNDGGEMFEN